MSRAWSIGKTDRFKIDAFQKKNRELMNVAPGTYESNLAQKRFYPKWSMAAKLTTIDKRLSASPDTYNIPSKMVESQGKTIGMRLGNMLSTTGKLQVPGPGTYLGEKAKIENFEYSMGKRLDNNKMNSTFNVPGPGNYNNAVTPVIESVKSMKFGTGQRSKMEQAGSKIVPGPGGHSPDYKALKNQSPKFGFGSERRSNKTIERMSYIPGPGNYKIASMIGNEAQSKTMHALISYSPERKEHAYKPGVGNYNPNPLSNLRTEPQYKVGTGSRQDLVFKKKSLFQQAPGNYNPQFSQTEHQTSKWRFGTEIRKNTAATVSPGPGNYQLDSVAFDKRSTRFYIGQKLKDPKANTTVPGSGAYNPSPENTKKQLPSYSMKIKLGSDLGKPKNVPGPGNYEIDKNAHNIQKAAPKFGFGTSTRNGKKPTSFDAPGPGSYKLNSSIGDIPEYAMPNRDVKYKYV